MSPKRKPSYPDTWHVQAGTDGNATNMQFLSVFDVYRQGGQSRLAEVKEMNVCCGLGARLVYRDGRSEEVSFCLLEEPGFPIHVRAKDRDGKTVSDWSGK